jgi:hypothetical protein
MRARSFSPCVSAEGRAAVDGERVRRGAAAREGAGEVVAPAAAAAEPADGEAEGEAAMEVGVSAEAGESR